MTTACANCLHRQPYHYRGEGECAFVNDEPDTCRCQRYRPPTQVTPPVPPAAHTSADRGEVLRVEDFDPYYRFHMVRAYPVISGVLDVYCADREQIDEGFRYVLENRNLRRTHELYLAERGTR
jgi:hypothetical protein